MKTLPIPQGMGKQKLFLVVTFLCVINFVVGIPPLQIDDPRFLGEVKEKVASMPMSSGPLVDYRLPGIVRPSNYQLKIRPILMDVVGSNYPIFSAPGEVTITVTVTEPTSTITLHSKNISVLLPSVTVKQEDGISLRITSQSFDASRDFYVIEVDRALQPGTTYKIYIPFTAQVSQETLYGMYKSTYVDPDTQETRVLQTTQFQPGHAREAFPCFDEPEFKATFDITVGRHDSYHSLSNMNQIESIPDSTDAAFANWYWDKYDTTVEMSTYLIAFIVSDFDYAGAKDQFEGKEIRTYGPKHLIAQKGGDYAAAAVRNMIEYFQKFTQITYALPKLDSVAIPQFSAGAMENWGLNTYRIPYILHIPGLNTEAERKKITQVLGHEVSHQWFGNLVTCKWWSDTWLNEGFARFLQYRGMQSAAPELNMSIAIISDATQLGMVFDHGPNTHPVRNIAQSPTEVSNIFDRISYDKGASLLRMLEGFLTTQVFDDSLRHYIKKMEYKSAVQDDLFASFQEVGGNNDKLKLPAGVTIKQVMESWTLQAGYPIVRVDKASNNKIYLSQYKYYLNSPAPRTNSQPDTAQHPGSWWIPVKIVSSSNPDFENKSPNVWIPDDVVTMSYSEGVDTSKWLIVNPELSGYYRVLYDPELLQLIKNQLEDDPSKISAGTRSQILEDYFNFANSRHVQIETVLELTSYLHKETELVVWAPVLTNLRAILAKFDTGDKKIAIFKNYFWPKFESVLNFHGWKQTNGEQGVQVILRSQLLDFACVLDSVECLKRIDIKYPSPAEQIPADIRPIVFCASVASGDQTVWDSVLASFGSEKEEIIKLQLYNALACTEDISIQNSYINEAKKKTHDLDLITTLKVLAKNSVGRQVVLNYIKENFNADTDPIDASQFADVLYTLSSYMGQHSQLDEVRTFVDANKDALDSEKTSIEVSLRKIQSNIDWWRADGLYSSNWMLQNTK